MVATASTIKLGGLARLLVQEKLLSEAEANSIQTQANMVKAPFITQVIASKKVSAEKIAEVSDSKFSCTNNRARPLSLIVDAVATIYHPLASILLLNFIVNLIFNLCSINYCT